MKNTKHSRYPSWSSLALCSLLIAVGCSKPGGGDNETTEATICEGPYRLAYFSSRYLDGSDQGYGVSHLKNVWTIKTDGTANTAVTNLDAATATSISATYSKDGSRIVFDSTRKLDGTDATPSPTLPANIWVVKPDGTELTALTNLTASTATSLNPRFTPDGTKIVYYSKRKLDGTDAAGPSAISNLWIIGVDGTGSAPLTSMTVSGSNSTVFSISPDGTKIAYSSSRKLDGTDAANTGSAFNIWIMNIDGTGATPLTDLTASGGSHLFPEFSADGTQVIFQSNRHLDGSNALGTNSNNNVWVIKTDGTGLTPLTSHTTTFVNANTPRFSPDGAKIVYRGTGNIDGTDTANTGNVPNVWIMNADGTGKLPLTALTNAFADSAIFTPDSKQVVYASSRKLDGTDTSNTSFHANLWIINADGTGNTALTNLASGSPVLKLDPPTTLICP